MKRFYTKDRIESSHTSWEGLAAAAGSIIISLLLFYMGLQLWAAVVIALICFVLLSIILKVAFTRTGESSKPTGGI